ncbi:MAG: RNA polymerase sigma factor [Acidimicrobiia bacterium]
MTTALASEPIQTHEELRAIDADLVSRIAQGDAVALREAYDSYAAHVNGVALGILKDRDLAADVTQEVFVRLWERHHRYDSTRGSLRSFLQMDSHGRSIDLLRSRRAAQARELADHRKQASTPAAGTEELAMTSATSSTVRSALMSLPDEQRTPVALAYFDGYSYREVAEVLDVPEGTIKSRIRTGMRRLQLALGNEAI